MALFDYSPTGSSPTVQGPVKTLGQGSSRPSLAAALAQARSAGPGQSQAPAYDPAVHGGTINTTTQATPQQPTAFAGQANRRGRPFANALIEAQRNGSNAPLRDAFAAWMESFNPKGPTP